jgi:8-amino-7-oxononanoate synthase
LPCDRGPSPLASAPALPLLCQPEMIGARWDHRWSGQAEHKMDWKSKLLEQGSKVLENPEVMRWLTDDRVMKVAEALMDAPERLKAAAKILKEGYALPNVDPALDEDRPDARSSIRSDSSSDPTPTGSEDMEESMSERRSLASIGGKDIFEKAFKFTAADNARKRGIYPFFRPLDFSDGPEAQIDGKRVIMLGSNNYLGLTTHPKVRQAAKDAIDKYGTSMTGSRLVNGSMNPP